MCRLQIRFPEVLMRITRMEMGSSLRPTSPSPALVDISHLVVTSFMDPKEDLVFADRNKPIRNANDPCEGIEKCS